jgi:hypothetical protein
MNGPHVRIHPETARELANIERVARESGFYVQGHYAINESDPVDRYELLLCPDYYGGPLPKIVGNEESIVGLLRAVLRQTQKED